MEEIYSEKPATLVTSVGPQVVYITINYNAESSDEGWKADNVQLKTEGAPTLMGIVDAIIQSGRLCSVQEFDAIIDAVLESFNVKFTHDEMFEAGKKLLLVLNQSYGSSKSVHVFFFDEEPLWVDKETRAAILSRIDAEEDAGKNTTNFTAEDCRFFNISIGSARDMLKKLEVYAAECYDMTQSHQLAIEDLETYSGVLDYEYKDGYPEPLTFGDEIFTYVQKEPTEKKIVAALKKFALPLVVEQDDDAALENVELFPSWESMKGKEVKQDERYYYDDALWKVVQTHTVQEDWNPRVAASLFTQVVKSEGGDDEEGTFENPIPFSLNMELVEGLYYLDEGVVYLCIESLNQCFWHLAAIPRYAQAVMPA
jgi:hypothetical protein